MIIIGEKLNGAIPLVAQAIAKRDGQCIRELAKRQADAGADFIDICASVDQGEAETLKWMIEQVESVTDVPVSIGSPSTEVLVEVYRFCNKPGLFNSTSMEKRKQIEQIFHIMKEQSGWRAIAMLCDDAGIPKSVEERLSVFDAIMEKAKAHGIDPARIYIDPMAEAAALMDPEQEDGPGISVYTKVVGAIRRKYPTIHIISAISNISYQLPVRKYMNGSLAALALAYGVDSGILNPLSRELLGVIKASEALLALPTKAFEQLINAVKENRGKGNGLLKLEGFEDEEGQKALEQAATVLAMGAGADVKLPTTDRNLNGMVYAARALLGRDEDGHCLEYIKAYKHGLFGV